MSLLITTYLFNTLLTKVTCLAESGNFSASLTGGWWWLRLEDVRSRKEA